MKLLSNMRPCPNPLIRIIIDDEDGDLPSINISPQTEDYEQNERNEHNNNDDTSQDEDEGDEEHEHHHHHHHYGDSPSHSLSSSVDSFIQHLDSLHPYRL